MESFSVANLKSDAYTFQLNTSSVKTSLVKTFVEKKKKAVGNREYKPIPCTHEKLQNDTRTPTYEATCLEIWSVTYQP